MLQLWYARHHPRISDIDCTDAILAVHQGLEGWKNLQKSTKHNHGVIFDEANTKYESQLNASVSYVSARGRTECMTYKLGHVRTPYINLYRRTVVGKGAFIKGVKGKCTKVCCTQEYTILKRDD